MVSAIPFCTIVLAGHADFRAISAKRVSLNARFERAAKSIATLYPLSTLILPQYWWAVPRIERLSKKPDGKCSISEYPLRKDGRNNALRLSICKQWLSKDGFWDETKFTYGCIGEKYLRTTYQVLLCTTLSFTCLHTSDPEEFSLTRTPKLGFGGKNQISHSKTRIPCTVP